MVDTDSLVIAKAVSRSLWPRSEDELKLGLRVDAMDHRGSWFQGSVIEIIDDGATGSTTAGEVEESTKGAVASTKRVRVHFDNFLPKWDEMYSIEHLKQGRVRPLYSHAVPKRKPTEFLVHHRHTDRKTGQITVFGQSFYVQCQNEWSNARAGAHILAQVCRFMQYHPGLSRSKDNNSSDASTNEPELKTMKLYERTHAAISDLIDLLVDCDREYIRLALGKSQHNKAEEKSRPFRNPTFDGSSLSSALVKKVTGLLKRLPFEVRICTVEGAHSDKPSANAEEVLFPFSLVRTIGNFMNIRHAVFLQWREPTIADNKQPAQVVSYRNFLVSPVMYVDAPMHIHEASASLMSENNDDDAKSTRKHANRAGGSAGIDLSYCLKEFCKIQKLSISDNWKCPVCKEKREGEQNMNLWRLPDVITFHIKRFNMSARWHEKITTKVNFPLTGLAMKDFCHPESPVVTEGESDHAVYDLIGVMNHYGSMTGGHYVATCKATSCSRHGREEVAYSFNGVGASTWFDAGLYDSAPNGATNNASTDVNLGAPWVKFGAHRTNKNQLEMANQTRIAVALASKSAGESAEPTWLQFDDEVVESVPPASVVSEMAYVLFYRRRNISASNIAKYSTFD
jgi:Ubiquitin carboxyl-terminal hydrolase